MFHKSWKELYGGGCANKTQWVYGLVAWCVDTYVFVIGVNPLEPNFPQTEFEKIDYWENRRSEFGSQLSLTHSWGVLSLPWVFDAHAFCVVHVQHHRYKQLAWFFAHRPPHPPTWVTGTENRTLNKASPGKLAKHKEVYDENAPALSPPLGLEQSTCYQILPENLHGLGYCRRCCNNSLSRSVA